MCLRNVICDKSYNSSSQHKPVHNRKRRFDRHMCYSNGAYRRVGIRGSLALVVILVLSRVLSSDYSSDGLTATFPVCTCACSVNLGNNSSMARAQRMMALCVQTCRSAVMPTTCNWHAPLLEQNRVGGLAASQVVRRVTSSQLPHVVAPPPPHAQVSHHEPLGLYPRACSYTPSARVAHTQPRVTVFLR